MQHVSICEHDLFSNPCVLDLSSHFPPNKKIMETLKTTLKHNLAWIIFPWQRNPDNLQTPQVCKKNQRPAIPLRNPFLPKVQQYHWYHPSVRPKSNTPMKVVDLRMEHPPWMSRWRFSYWKWGMDFPASRLRGNSGVFQNSSPSPPPSKKKMWLGA